MHASYSIDRHAFFISVFMCLSVFNNQYIKTSFPSHDVPVASLVTPCSNGSFVPEEINILGISNNKINRYK